jgi:DNA-binding IscR family transcriptional regulator
LGLKKDDLIKTTKGNIGIVISTNKDNIKILDISNVIQIVGNLDYESKINTHNLVAKNRTGDQIKNQTIVRIRKGIHEVLFKIFRG